MLLNVFIISTPGSLWISETKSKKQKELLISYRLSVQRKMHFQCLNQTRRDRFSCFCLCVSESWVRVPWAKTKSSTRERAWYPTMSSSGLTCRWVTQIHFRSWSNQMFTRHFKVHFQSNWSLYILMWCFLKAVKCLLFLLQDDCNFVVYEGKKPLWATNTRNRPGYVKMQADGNLVVYDLRDGCVWSSATYRETPYSSVTLKLTDEGKLVITTNEGELWSSS